MRVVAIAVALLGSAGCCEPISYDVDDDFAIREDDPTHAEAISRCFAVDSACERLCIDLLGPPPSQTIRSIRECTVNRDGTGGLAIHARSHVVEKCEDDVYDDPWTWEPVPDAWREVDAMEVTDAWREEIDASPPDAAAL